MNFSFWIFYYPYSMPATSPKDVKNASMPIDGDDVTDARCAKKDIKKSER